MILTYRYRIKDASARRHLRRFAMAVNTVWNFCGETQMAAQRWGKPWPSEYTLQKLTTGSSDLLGINATTICAVCSQFVVARRAAKRRPRWRGRKSLGWVPIKSPTDIRLVGDAVIYRKRRFRFWDSRKLAGEIKCGSFGEDARGRWYFQIQCEVAEDKACGTGAVGIDLGLKTLAAMSTGEKIENRRHFDRHAAALARAQRARRKARVRAINAKIAACRRHYLHEQTTRLVRRFQKIVVGDVNSSAMIRGFAGKSVSDAAWSEFRNQLRYKAIKHGAEYVEANERYSSQACSECGSISGPKGRKGLEIRAWVCGDCGAVHDRDVNAAVNLLLGAERRPPVVGIAA